MRISIPTKEGEPAREARLWFRYRDLSDCKNPMVGVNISFYDEPGIVFSGRAFCHPKDRYEKVIGQKIALTNLFQVHDWFWTREKRTAVWKAYFEGIKAKQRNKAFKKLRKLIGDDVLFKSIRIANRENFIDVITSGR